MRPQQIITDELSSQKVRSIQYNARVLDPGKLPARFLDGHFNVMPPQERAVQFTNDNTIRFPHTRVNTLHPKFK